jgi:hypothetical protein
MKYRLKKKKFKKKNTIQKLKHTHFIHDDHDLIYQGNQKKMTTRSLTVKGNELMSHDLPGIVMAVFISP